MRASVVRNLRTATLPGTRNTYRFRVLRPPTDRKFHHSKLYLDSEKLPPKHEEELTGRIEETQGIRNDNGEADSKPGEGSFHRRMKNGTGFKWKKSRPNSNDGLPPIELPDWFLQKNVHYNRANDWIELTRQYSSKTNIEEEIIDLKDPPPDDKSHENKSNASTEYMLNQDVYTEILATLKAGLSLRPSKNTVTHVTLRPINVLQCQKDGASIYLDHIVSKLCSDLGTDLVQIDAQDIAQIVGPYLDENIAWNASTTAFYGYNAQKISGKLEDFEDFEDYKKADQGSEQSSLAAEQGLSASIFSNVDVFSAQHGDEFSKLLGIFVKKPGDNSRTSAWSHDDNNGNKSLDQVPGDRTKENNTQNPWNEIKLNAILKAIVEAVDLKRSLDAKNVYIEDSQKNLDPSFAKDSKDLIQDREGTQRRPLMVQIKDYQELRSLDGGIDILQKLHKIVNKKWLDGREIICVGTTEGADDIYDKRDIQMLQEDINSSEKRTILVPPDRKKSQDIKFETDRKLRIREINIRHLEDMILKLSEGTKNRPIVEIENNLDSSTVFASGLEENVWTFPRIYRIATVLLGLSDLSQSFTESKIDGNSLSRALAVISSSDDVKFAWSAEEIKESDALAAKASDAKKPLRPVYNTYEKKLLSGVVLPEKIRITFADIRVPEDTIDTLKTLTSLSLTRPEAFTYGILRRDRIPGILLYGPPGTGKTLLAKAVAKESGATVLEVTAADLNNMYVGEGEKNVKALFTLAKKLSPCVIFIDEADSMFGSREGARQRASHREMINQFLREWDGISDFNGFIMVATNRPYDLDDAILRRLPRRLLVDLPLEKDREEILKIHLKDEVLDDSVSLSSLARNTPYYSGSDLKNLCVAAALACVREENEIAAQHTGKEVYEYPRTRILSKRHIDKAIHEISASINEDMSSLKAIKKFDEKYGDRKGRRKKAPGLGFGGTQVVEIDSGAARVRPIDVI